MKELKQQLMAVEAEMAYIQKFWMSGGLTDEEFSVEQKRLSKERFKLLNQIK